MPDREITPDRKIAYRKNKRIAAQTLLAFFRRNLWWDWYTPTDVAWRIHHALFLATAWHGRKIVGVAMLTGDGRLDVELRVLVVDDDYQRQGIGTHLMNMCMAEAERLQPCMFRLLVPEKRTERYYRRFKFRKHRDTWPMEHAPTARRLQHRVATSRKRRGVA